MKKTFHVIFFVSILLLHLMSSSIHVFSHHHDHDDHEDDHDTCELCEYAFLGQDLDLYIPSNTYEIVLFQHNFPNTIDQYKSISPQRRVDNFHFTRPPPLTL